MKGWITWGEMVMYVVAGGAIYYAYLLLAYFRQHVKKHAKDQQPMTWKRTAPGEINDQPMKAEPASSPMTSSIHELMDELKEVFHAAVQDKLMKEQILEALRAKLNKYPVVASSNFREAIHQHITSELSLQVEVNISPAELDVLW